MKKIIINNKDLDVITIDMYQTFDMDREAEIEIEAFNDNHGTDYEYDDLDINYDFEAYRDALAKASIECMEDQLENDPIIKKIELISSQSPRFYNYTTDSYTASFKYDPKKLIQWIRDHADDWLVYMKEWDCIQYDRKIRLDSLDLKKGTIEIDDPVWNENDRKYVQNVVIKKLEDHDDISACMIAYYLKNTLYQVDHPFLCYYEDINEKVYAGEYITIKKAEDHEEKAL